MVDVAVMESPQGLADEAAVALAALAGADVGAMVNGAVPGHLEALYGLRALVDAAIVETVGVFDGRKLYGFDGMFSTATWVTGRVGVHRAGVSTMVKVAREARGMPLTIDALRAGRLSFDKLRLLAAAHGVSEKTAADYDANEAEILATVEPYTAEQTAMFVSLWTAASDPDADESSHDDRDKTRRVNLSRSLDGMGFLDGLLTTEGTAIVNGQLETIIDDLHRWGLACDAEGHRLTAAQLRHDALIEMALRAGASSTEVQVRGDARRRAGQAPGAGPEPDSDGQPSGSHVEADDPESGSTESGSTESGGTVSGGAHASGTTAQRSTEAPTPASDSDTGDEVDGPEPHRGRPAFDDGTDPGAGARRTTTTGPAPEHTEPETDADAQSDADAEPGSGAGADTEGATPPASECDRDRNGAGSAGVVDGRGHRGCGCRSGEPPPTMPSAAGLGSRNGAGHAPPPDGEVNGRGPDTFDPVPPGPDPPRRGHDRQCRCGGERAVEALLTPPGATEGSGLPGHKVAGGLGHPLFNVLVDIDTLEGRSAQGAFGRVAQIVGHGSIPDSAIQRLMCDAGVARIVTRGRSLPLDVGSVSRTATPAQWRALIAFAGGCEFPGCECPWEWTEAHHLDHWTRTHETNYEGLALECHGHHTLLHQPGWSMARRPDGTIVVSRPDGTTLTRPPRRPPLGSRV
ncbi:HNH endonuclease [Iamia sp.]|uniref:HNH endonuclease signature motif containing protein n=1 Tax=Iamia sp. TaxID=2722710 RepID=UPI002CEFF4F7|nr:DUF222 domain-containing protein [Iamia sp.]HXH58342.1 DUF222 domain-containing protein [Iamia sp.]